MSCISWNLQSDGGGRGGRSWKIPSVQAQSRQCRDLPASWVYHRLLSPLSLWWHQLGLLPPSKGNFFYVPAHRKAGRATGGRAYLEEGGFLKEDRICAALSLEQHTDRHRTMKIKTWWMSAVSSSPSPSHVVCPVSKSTATATRLPGHPSDYCSVSSKRTCSFLVLHFNALLLYPQPPHYSLITFTCCKEVLPFLIEYSLQTLAENDHTPYL